AWRAFAPEDSCGGLAVPETWLSLPCCDAQRPLSPCRVDPMWINLVSRVGFRRGCGGAILGGVPPEPILSPSACSRPDVWRVQGLFTTPDDRAFGNNKGPERLDGALFRPLLAIISG